MSSHQLAKTRPSASSRSSDTFTQRSRQSGSLVPPNPSTITEPSGNCVTRSASPAAGSGLAASRSWVGCDD